MKRILLAIFLVLLFATSPVMAARVYYVPDISVRDGAWCDVRSYGAIGDGATDDSAAVILAVAAAANNTVVFPEGTYLIDDDVTVPATVSLQFNNGATLSIAATRTLTINGGLIAPMSQIFSGSGSFAGNPRIDQVHTEWFGAVADGATDCSQAITDAIQFAYDAGVHKVKLLSGEYLVESPLWWYDVHEMLIEGTGPAHAAYTLGSVVTLNNLGNSYPTLPGWSIGLWGAHNGGDGSTDRIIDTTKNFVDIGVTVGTYVRKMSYQTRSFFVPITSIETTTNPNDTLVCSGGFGSLGGVNITIDDSETYSIYKAPRGWVFRNFKIRVTGTPPLFIVGLSFSAREPVMDTMFLYGGSADWPGDRPLGAIGGDICVSPSFSTVKFSGCQVGYFSVFGGTNHRFVSCAFTDNTFAGLMAGGANFVAIGCNYESCGRAIDMSYHFGYQISFTLGSTVPSWRDEIEGVTSGATGTVAGWRVSSGSWGGGDAAGDIVLRDVSGTFQSEVLENTTDAVADFATCAGVQTVYADRYSNRYEGSRGWYVQGGYYENMVCDDVIYLDSISESTFGSFYWWPARLGLRLAGRFGIVVYSGSSAPSVGDTIEGAGSGATGEVVVVRSPSLGSWAGGDAYGRLLLTNISGVFVADEQLDIQGGIANFATAADDDFSQWCSANTITGWAGNVTFEETTKNSVLIQYDTGVLTNDGVNNLVLETDLVKVAGLEADWDAGNDYLIDVGTLAADPYTSDFTDNDVRYYSTEEITNGDFETDIIGNPPTGWGGSNSTLDTVAGGVGATQCMEVTAVGVSTSGASGRQWFATVVGMKYLVSYAHKNGSNRGRFNISSSGYLNYAGDLYTNPGFYISDADWTTRTGEFTATTTTTYLSATIYGNLTGGETTLFDNISVMEIQGGNVIATGKFTGGGANGITVDASGNVTVDGVLTPTSLIIPSGVTPTPDTEGALFLDTNESANGSLMMYGNGAWRKVMDLP